MMNRGLVESRSLAQRLVMAGEVRVNGQVASKPSMMVDDQAEVAVESGPPFVSRGGEKLEGAVQAFNLDLRGKTCADVGASTGGFTDCMLQHGAVKVFAIDVGYGVLHWKLRQDGRVVSMERTNARHVESLSEPVQMVTVDASFISLRILLPVLVNWFGPEGGEVVALIKPQFEAGRQEAAHGEGVIQDPQVHRHVLEEILGFAAGMGLTLRGLICSPLKGPKGNIEFLGYWQLGGGDPRGLDWQESVDQMMAELAARSAAEEK